MILLVVFLACSTAGNISSKYTNGFDDTISLNLYNGTISNEFHTFEISRYFDPRSPIDFTFKINFYSVNQLLIRHIYIETDNKEYVFKKPIYTKRRKQSDVYSEVLLFVLSKEQIKELVFSEKVFIEFRGEKGNVPFLLLDAHKNILKDFYKRVIMK